MVEQAHHHRSTTKNVNKKYKGQQKNKSGGKVNEKKRADVKSITSTNKTDRRNRAKLIQQNKREAHVNQKRSLFNGINSGVPKIISIIPLCSDVSASAFVEKMFKTAGQEFPGLDYTGQCTLNLERFKQKIQFIPLQRDLISILDALKVSDFACFLISATEPVDVFGDLCLASIKGQGVLSSTFSVVDNLELVPKKEQSDVKKSLTKFMQYHFSDEHRFFQVNQNEQDAWNYLRYITSQIPKSIPWRDRHSYMLAEKIEFESTAGSVDPVQTGTLKVTGYIRGLKLSPNRLVHLQNFGEFQIEKVTEAINPNLPSRSNEMAVDVKVLSVPDPSKQESLINQNEPDLMDAEQTWPTDGEIQEAQNNLANKARKVRVPKGTSSYQAAWIMDDEVDEEEDVCEDEDENQMDWDHIPGFYKNEKQEDDEEEFEVIDINKNEGAATTIGDDDRDLLDGDEEQRQYLEYMKEKQKEKESREDAEFPDEVDTPQDLDARVRFQRFRGLKSFRTSPWDPYENLPVDYSRIFQFHNFSRTKKQVLKTIQEEGQDVISCGSYVTIHIANVPSNAYLSSIKAVASPFIMFTLLPHENKISVLNFSVARPSKASLAETLAYAAQKSNEVRQILSSSNENSVNPNNDQDISVNLTKFNIPKEYIVKSKDTLLICYGFRKFIVKPVYSSFTRDGGNNVHKFERFLNLGATSVGTVYAPIQFGPAPITLFRVPGLDLEGGITDLSQAQTPILIGTGSILHNDPSRIIAKRIILTGHPFKIHKKVTTIRYMFHNPEDVNYFRPIQLTTKYGRKGHIKCSLGTKGYMKCIFDEPIQAHDTVCMSLYKRVFPKWDTTRIFNSADVVSFKGPQIQEIDESAGMGMEF